MFHAFKMKLYIAFELDWLGSFMNFSQQKCVLCSGPWALLGCAMQGVEMGLDMAPAFEELVVLAATYCCWLHSELF